MNRRNRSAVALSSSYPRSSPHPLFCALQSALDAGIFDSLRRLRSHAIWSHYSLTLTAILIAWSDASRLRDRFDEARDTLSALGPGVSEAAGTTYRGYSKTLARITMNAIGVLRPALQRQIREVAGSSWRIGQWIPIAVDGSKFDLPQTSDNLGAFGVAAKRGSGPQSLVTLAWHMGIGVPWTWFIDHARGSERAHLRSMIDETPRGALFVGDAGFMGFDLLRDIRRSGRHFLIRAAGNAKLLTDLGYWEREGLDTVYLWPDERKSCPPLVLRLITVKRRKRATVFLVTSVLDRAAMSRRLASTMYKLRWGVEVQYRSLKQTMERRKMLSRASRYARVELDWLLIATTVLGLLHARALAMKKIAPSRASFAAGLRVVRRAMRRAWRERFDLFIQLAKAVKDTYVRRKPKSKGKWPMKKQTPPLKPPTIIPATAAQIERARLLRTIQ